ncbi:MAG: LysR family transcriptional regulator [Clostridiales bacterium]
MEIKQLQYFVVSVDMGSFHGAARSLLTTQPNVSKTVKALEEELDMVLLQRNHRGVEITAVGQEIYNYAIEVLKNMNNIEKYKKCKDIEVLSISSVPSNMLASILAKFYKDLSKNHEIKMEFWEGSVEKIITRIHRRESELGFVYISDRNVTIFQNQVRSKGLEFIELKKTPLYLYLGKNNPYYGFESISEDVIHKMKFIQHHEEQYSLFNHLGHLQKGVFNHSYEAKIASTNSDHFLLQLLRNTDYCTISSNLFKDSDEIPGLRAIPIESCGQCVSFGYLKRKLHSFSPITRIFLKYLENQYEIGDL